MIKIINVLVGFLILSSLSYSQEVVCQNGRCDVVKKVASVAVSPVVTGLQIAKYYPQNYLWSSDNPQTKQTKQTKHRQTVTNEEAVYDVALIPKRTAKLERRAISGACGFFSRLKCR
jgi:hypothetical protein